MAEMNGLGLLLLGFVLLLVGIIFIGIVADEITRVNQANTVTNETITLTNQSVTSLDNSQLDSFTSLVNASNGSQVYTLNTDYTVDLSAGEITSLGPSGDANATYVYREVGSATARTLTNLVNIFFALGILGISIFVGLKGLRDMGLLNK